VNRCDNCQIAKNWWLALLVWQRGLDPARFTIKTLPARLEKVGDLWEPVPGPGIDLAACLERLSSAYL